jgi:hypothetical protein
MLYVSCSTRTNDNKSIEATATKTESFKVWGQCEMCRERIEKAVIEEGATNASWEIKTQMLTITYNPAITNRDVMSKKLASVGHDTEKYRASDEVYSNLPACCHYERRK